MSNLEITEFKKFQGFWPSSQFFSFNYFQIGQHVVLLHILIRASDRSREKKSNFAGF